jgi:pimeloyl-ACP methyl ester carboxylesterase
MSQPRLLDRGDGSTIAYHAHPGKSPGVVFCGGFASDMTGTKAIALDDHCRRTGRAFVRFDYFGHGASAGEFAAGTISRWAEDAVAVIDRLTEGPQILVGSSMGGWIVLLAALARPDRVAALVGIAPAPDFTEDLMWAEFDEPVRRTLLSDGVYHQPSEYSDTPYTISYRLIEDGRRNLLLRAPIPLDQPLRILQGMRDPDVPWQHALRVAEAYAGTDVTLTLIKDGDHRLSSDADIARLIATVDALAA